MRFSVWPGPHQDFADILALALHVEAGGWDGVWLADHFLPAGGDPRRPTVECWTALAALAARVPRVTLGSLVTGNTYRHPAILAKMAAGVDRISGGRRLHRTAVDNHQLRSVSEPFRASACYFR